MTLGPPLYSGRGEKGGGKALGFRKCLAMKTWLNVFSSPSLGNSKEFKIKERRAE